MDDERREKTPSTVGCYPKGSALTGIFITAITNRQPAFRPQPGAHSAPRIARPLSFPESVQVQDKSGTPYSPGNRPGSHPVGGSKFPPPSRPPPAAATTMALHPIAPQGQ